MEAPTDINEYQNGWESGPKLVVINSKRRKEWENMSIRNTSFVDVGIYNLEGKDYFYIETADTELLSARDKKKEIEKSGSDKPVSSPLPTTEETLLWLLQRNDSNEQVKKWSLEIFHYISKELNKSYLNEKFDIIQLLYLWKKRRVLVIKPQKKSLSINFGDNEITQNLKYAEKGWWLDDLKRKKTIKENVEFSKIFELVKDYLKKILV